MTKWAVALSNGVDLRAAAPLMINLVTFKLLSSEYPFSIRAPVQYSGFLAHDGMAVVHTIRIVKEEVSK